MVIPLKLSTPASKLKNEVKLLKVLFKNVEL